MKHAPRSLPRLERWEVEATLHVASMRENPLVKLLSGAAQISDQPPMIGSAAAALAAGLIVDNRRLAEAGLRVLASALAATALKSLVENSVQRTRPNAVLDGKAYRRKRGGSDSKDHKSFPSGHTADAFAAAGALTRVYPEHKAAIWSAAALIAAVQVPAGAHYPSDLVAGAIVGLTGEAAANLLVKGLLSGLEA